MYQSNLDQNGPALYALNVITLYAENNYIDYLFCCPLHELCNLLWEYSINKEKLCRLKI